MHARDIAVLDALEQLRTRYIKPSSKEDSFVWLVNLAIYGAETDAGLVANASCTTVVTKTPSTPRGRSEKPELDLWPIQQ